MGVPWAWLACVHAFAETVGHGMGRLLPPRTAPDSFRTIALPALLAYAFPEERCVRVHLPHNKAGPWSSWVAEGPLSLGPPLLVLAAPWGPAPGHAPLPKKPTPSLCTGRAAVLLLPPEQSREFATAAPVADDDYVLALTSDGLPKPHHAEGLHGERAVLWGGGVLIRVRLVDPWAVGVAGDRSGGALGLPVPLAPQHQAERLFPSPWRVRILPHLNGRVLRVSTFCCPPFSYGVPGGSPCGLVGEASAGAAGDPTAPVTVTTAVTATPTTQEGDVSTVPAVDAISRGGGGNGIEMRIFLALARRLGFAFAATEPRDGHMWGKLSEANDTWSGGVTGALARRRVHVAFCYIWVSVHGWRHVDLARPWTQVCNTFLAPLPGRVVSLDAVWLPLEGGVWAALTTVLLIGSAVTAAVARRVPSAAALRSPANALLELFGALLLAHSREPARVHGALRPLLGSWQWLALLAAAAYCSRLVALLTVPRLEPPLDSVKDLLLRGLFWEEFYVPYVEMTLNPENSWHAAFIHRLRLMPPSRAGLLSDGAVVSAVLLEGARAHVQPEHVLPRRALLSLRPLRECTSHFFVALGLPRRSPLTRAFDEALARMEETGILAYIQEDVVRRLGDPQAVQRLLASRDRPSGEVSKEPSPLAPRHLVGAFVLWVAGLAVAVAALLAERVCCRRCAHLPFRRDSTTGPFRRFAGPPYAA